MSPAYRSIVTHNDFDGLGSAALCSWAYQVNKILFTGPVDIYNRRFPITRAEIVCDLPCPGECGLWFDHHQGNAEDLRQRGIDPGSIPGRFAPEKSCGRVVLNHLLAEGRTLPAHFGPLADAMDVVDSFDYRSIEEWRARTPAHVITDALKVPFADYRVRNQSFRNIVFHLRDFGLEKTAALPEVRRHHQEYRAYEGKMLELLERDARPWDPEGEIVLVDLTHYAQRPFVWKNLAQVLFPEAGAVLAVECAFREGRKTNDLAFSMSLTIRENCAGTDRDLGEIMRTLNIGDGHWGAAGGRLPCRSKDEMLRRKDEMIARIAELWKAQGRKTSR
ncbi:MAG: hypothetical protein HY900_33155 [Deltaproteobacteria bacterium]|nr:hypothetical protein [Deltaproteobacteria bacterium]